MKQALLRLYNWSWRLFIAALFILLLVVAGARVVVSCLPFFQESITRYLDEQLDASLNVDQLTTDWQGGMPVLTVRGLRLQGVDATQPGLKIGQLDLELSFGRSLLYLTPVFNYLKADGVSLRLAEDSSGRWTLSGIEGLGSHKKQREIGRPMLFNWLQHQGQLNVSGSSLTVVRADGKKASLNVPAFSLKNDGEEKKLAARFEFGAGFLSLTGSGIGYGDNLWQGEIAVNDIDLTQACPLFSDCQNRLARATVAGNMSWLYDNGKWQAAGNLSIPEVHYTSESGNSHKASSVASLFSEGFAGGEWSLWLNNVAIALDNQRLVLGDWYVEGKKAPDYSVTIANKHIQLEPLKLALLHSELLPVLPAELLTVLNPRGAVNDVALRLFPFREPFDIDLSAQLDRVAVDAWRGAPSAGNVSGSLRMSLLKGYLDLDAEQFSLGFPTLFPESWHYNSAKARLYWDVVDGRYTLKSDQIRLKGQEGQLTGQLTLDIPLNGKPLKMALAVGLKEGKLQYAKKYIPAKLAGVSGDLAKWLDFALRSGSLHEGGFLYNGVLEKTDTSGDVNWGLYFDVSDALFDYHKDWPAVSGLTGKVFVNNSRVEVHGKHADVLGARLINVTARVPLQGDTVVSVRGRAVARKNVLQRFFTETPINSLMGGEAKKWQLNGDLSSQLQLTIPIAHPQDAHINIKGEVKNYSLVMPEYKVDVDQINGDIGFSTTAGLTSKKLRGVLLGQSIEASIATVMSGHVPTITKINWRGKTNIESVHEWLAIDALSLLKGEANYSADLSVNHSRKKVTIDVSSDLQGVSVKLPAPLYKKASSKQSLRMKYTAQAGGSDLNLTLSGLAKATVRFNPDNAIQGAAVVVGSGVRSDTSLPSVRKDKIQVQGSLPELDVTPWYSRFKNQPASTQERSFSDWLTIDKVSVGRLRYEDYLLNDVQVVLGPDGDSLKLAVDSDSVTGNLWIPERESQSYRLVLDQLRLPGSTKEQGNASTQSDTLALSPLSVPAADVSIGSLEIGKQTIKHLSFNLRRMPDGIQAESLQANLSGMTLKGRGEWIQREGKQHTWFDGELEGKKLEQLQENFGYSSFVKAKESMLTGKLNWPGSPMDAGIASVAGTVGLHMHNGRLKKMEGGAGALKLFGLLNIESLRRRLKLDFSDLYASGISFDKLDGTLRFNKGIITFDTPIVIEGPSSDFKLDGLFDGNQETMDVSVVVTLPVTSNLPIFSVLLGAAPQVAGIIYLADKLVGKQVAQLASIRYQIKGTFDKPEVSLDKLFSNKTKK